MKFNRWTAVAAAFFALMAADAFAQLGSIRGKILDKDGNPVGGVKCSIELLDGRSMSVTTKDNGQFTKGGVRSGMYTVTCEKEGYREILFPTRQVSAFSQLYLGEQVMYERAPGELSESQHARANELLSDVASESGNHEETLAKLFELKEMMPDTAGVYFNIGTTYDQMGDKDQAVEYYTIAAEKGPDLAYASYLAVADLHRQAKAWSEAAAAMKKATDIRATDPEAVFNHALYAQNAGDTETALTAFEQTLELKADHAMAHYQAGLILVGKLENAKALAHFEQFLTLAPDHPRAQDAQEVVTALNADKAR